jgi:HK97 family phage prohead protease
MDEHRNREKLVDVRETRRVAEPFEFREDAATGRYLLSGYAATWEPYDCYGGPERGGWVEQLSRAAFQQTLSQSPDVMLLINHEGLPLARTKSGTLQLSTDNHGLLMRADLDPTDPDVQRLVPKMKPQANGNSNLDEMSFSFRVKTHRWDTNHTNREITELSLQKGDVSVVNYGMNPNTHATLSTDAVGALASLSNQDLLEVRRMDRTTLGRAMLTLERAWRSGEPDDRQAENFGGKQAKPFGKDGGDDKDDEDDERSGAFGGKTFVNFDGSHLLHDGICVTCAGERAKTDGKTKPYGDVPYADPKNNKYPIDKEHVKAAWSYINMPKNQKGYTAGELAAIKGRIRAAMKKFGFQVSDDKKALRDAADCTCPDDDCPVHGDRQQEMGYRVEAVRAANGGISMVAVADDGTRTPLPSFRQSGQLYSIPAAYRAASGDASNIAGGALTPYDYNPPDDVVSHDSHDDPYTKDTSEVSNLTSSAHTHEVATPAARDLNKPDSDDDKDEDDRADDFHDSEDNPDMDGDDPIALSVDSRLKELRHDADLPDLPTLDEALNYIRQFA